MENLEVMEKSWKKIRVMEVMKKSGKSSAESWKKQVNLGVIKDYAKFLAENGIHGVLVNGTSGEGMSMTQAERKATTEAWIAASKPTRIHVQVQVGGTNMPDVLDLAKHAEGAGAHSLLCLPELFNKPASAAELIEYLGAVAAAAPKTPLLYYHNPGYTSVNLDVPSFMSAAAQAIPTFAGIKFTDTNLEMGIKCVRQDGGAHSVFLGCDYVLAGAFALGFSSSIATCLNLLPRLCNRILDSVQRGSVLEAREAQDTLNKAAQAITKNGKWVPAMKAAMKLLTGLDMGPARAPLRSLPDQHIPTLKKDLMDLKLL
ncbi:N-acetylneuraminate lyase [Frankliniella fusca]|uniref:N-acetylneuraminate lyase n=1 Tax=Frankliniella fusca TaxID=407009 RepID=A0AAE1L9A1_9NEOP|nr:N-acetylneuraminate lyase [Frankliniella fusca]